MSRQRYKLVTARPSLRKHKCFFSISWSGDVDLGHGLWETNVQDYSTFPSRSVQLALGMYRPMRSTKQYRNGLELHSVILDKLAADDIFI